MPTFRYFRKYLVHRYNQATLVIGDAEAAVPMAPQLPNDAVGQGVNVAFSLKHTSPMCSR